MKEPMLETLLKILSWDLPAPEIILEDDGDLGLEWIISDFVFSLSIAPSGKVSWTGLYTRRHPFLYRLSGKKYDLSEHGTDIERAKVLLAEMAKGEFE